MTANAKELDDGNGWQNHLERSGPRRTGLLQGGGFTRDKLQAMLMGVHGQSSELQARRRWILAQLDFTKGEARVALDEEITKPVRGGDYAREFAERR